MVHDYRADNEFTPKQKDSKRYGISRQEAEKTGLPLYIYRQDVPLGLVPKSHCYKAKCPIEEKEQPVAYFLSRMKRGYIPLYKRDGLNINDI